MAMGYTDGQMEEYIMGYLKRIVKTVMAISVLMMDLNITVSGRIV
jgi:hypothetical protein